MTDTEFPHEVRYLSGKDIEEKYRDQCKDRVLVGAKKWCLPKRYVLFKGVYYNFKLRSDDVWIMGFPRSGTTMTQEMIWLIANDLDFKTAKEVIIQDRVPFLEWGTMSGHKFDGSGQAAGRILDQKLNDVINMECRRFIKTHLPFSLLPPNLLQEGCKIIYVARNPKDVITSLYNFYDLMETEGYKLTFREHCDLFKKGLQNFCPYLEHVREAWDLRNEENFMFLFYEDILKDKPAAMRKIAAFLGKTLTEKDIEDLNKHLDIKNFKKNKTLNNSRLRDMGLTNKNREHDFIRKGIIGDWKNYADEELDKDVNKWLEESIAGSGISFKYE